MDVGLGRRIGAWFRGQPSGPVAPRSRAATRAATGELEAFARSRTGVEAFLEPRTSVYSTTLLLVADDGEYLRRPVDDGAHAAHLCRDLDVPLYEAAKVGYPRRLRDFERGQRTARVELSDLPPWPTDDPRPRGGSDDAGAVDDSGPADEGPAGTGPSDDEGRGGHLPG
ncbi:MAG: hypothetical protein WDZ26_03710 [Nitriliruptoraceae bacterium]